MKHTTDLAVIGGGAVGICSAHYLREKGLEVSVIEKGEICSGSSYGNAGIIVPSHAVPLAAPGMVSKGLKWMFNPESPFYIKPRLDLDLLSWLWKFRGACNRGHVLRSVPVIRDLHLASLELFGDLAAINGLEFGFEKKGMVLAFLTHEGLEEGQEEARLMEENGVKGRILSAQELRDLEELDRTEAIGGIYYPQDAQITPQQFVCNLASHIQQRGVKIFTSTEVLDFDTVGRTVTTIKTTKGNIRAREIVLAGGSWSPGIARNLDLRLPIQPAKGYSVTFKRPSHCPPIPLNMAEAKVVLTPMGDIVRFAGTLELAGFDLTINKRRVHAILKSVPSYLPDLKPESLELIEIWRGLRPCTPDGLPFLGRSPRYQNLIVAAGHAMIGMSLSAITGKLVSEIATNEAPSIDLHPLRVDRFG